MICAAAADRLMHVRDDLSYHAIAHTTPVPRDRVILREIARYSAAPQSRSARDRASGLILGQCAAYGFDPGSFDACVRARRRSHTPPAVAARSCLAHREWTDYHMQ